MTAAQIAKAIGHSKFRINYKYAEFLADWMYDENPIPRLEMKTKNYQHVVSNFLDNIDFEDSTLYYDEILNCYPEGLQIYDRIKSIDKDVASEFPDTSRSQLHLIISHGYLVNHFTEHHGERRDKYVKYCAISGVQISESGTSLIFKGSHDHVQTISIEH